MRALPLPLPLPLPLLILATALAAAEPPTGSITLDLKQDLLETAGPLDALTEVVMKGPAKRYDPGLRRIGLHITGGRPVRWAGILRGHDTVSAQVIGVHGAGSELRFAGTWLSDQGGSHPLAVLTAGGRLVFTAEARVDFVLAGSFYTRQLWAGGDGTGVIELAPGFIADRTRDGTEPDACGTIRLNGVTLVTHASRSLPYNTRPDGRGGIYANGHVVLEGPGSTWRVMGEAQTYPAQIDFHQSGTLDCQTALTHTGQRRECLDVGGSGPFMSTGAFRTCQPGVTITKTGPAMLSLDGQQGYLPEATLVVAEGLLRVHTDPAAGDLYDAKAGDHLHLVVRRGARAYLGAPRVRLRALTVEDGATLEVGTGTAVAVAGAPAIAAGATVVGRERIRGGG